MPLLFVEHDRRLKVARAKALPPLPADVEALSRNGTTVITCRSGSKSPDKILKRVNALKRFPEIQADTLHFHAIESDSPLAPIWLWDIVHSCAVGSMLTFSGDDAAKAWLRRRYFARGLEIAAAEGGKVGFRKVAPLPAESDTGLDAWSFCIPVGPGDPTQLNAIVGRILELKVPELEIILCGTPGDGFLYGNRVRIIGQDLPAGPLIPGLKKNMLAEAASHGNLCIMHDRVFLPRAFMRAIRAFGDLYPITTFQSLYFDDRVNLDYRRYSDIGKVGVQDIQLPDGTERNCRGVSHVSPATLATLEASHIACPSALRFDRDKQYATGSLSLCKRSVWLEEPQSGTLQWAQYEDVEHGLRSSAAGIPTRVNPHAISQSVSARPILSWCGYVTWENAAGHRHESRSFLGAFPLPRKPLLRQSPAAMSAQLETFLVRHSDEPPINPSWARFTHRTTGRKRLKAIANTLKYIRYPVSEQACREMIRDYEKLIIGDQLSYAQMEQLVGYFRREGPRAFPLLLTTRELVNQLAQRPGRRVFAALPAELFPRRGLWLHIGSVITALLIAGSPNPPVKHAGGFLHLLRDILDTTPRPGRAFGHESG